MNSKQELIYGIEKRFKTTMIGSLAQFEQRFQHLWTENEKDDDVDKDRKKYYYELWQDTRDEILNNGNHQSRSSIKALKDFLYPNTTKYKYNFKFREEGE